MNNDATTTVEDRVNPGLRPSLPSGVGTKFYPDGSVRPFPGNTIICHVPAGAARNGLLDLHACLARLDLNGSISLLPISSLHMTVFEGVCDQVRKPNHWPDDLAIDAPLDVCNALFEKKLRHFDLDCEPPYHLRIEKLERLATGIGLRLLPNNDDENRRLRDLRNRLSTLLHLRHADHESYVFHISFAYIIRQLTPEQVKLIAGTVADWQMGQPILELGGPEFCKFENMFHFERQFELGGNGTEHDCAC
jgi:hypothetical protein